MSAGYPSKKEKRRRPSNDVNNSFVKNVTSRMSGFLPSSITKWFGSSSSLNDNGSAPAAESSDSSTEDEAPENSITEPPSKRKRLNSSSLSNNIPETKCTGTNTEPTETFSAMNSPAVQTLIQESVSTPVCSPHDETISELKKDTPVQNLQNSYLSTGNKSNVKKRKSLFDTPNVNTPNNEKSYDKPHRWTSVLDFSQPYFKPGLPSSSFYTGQTRYGGASSSYINQPNIKERKNTLLSKSVNNDNVTVSYATRRVMDLLENYSSPLIEAKRISQFGSSNSLDNSHTTNEYKSEELHVPSIAKILRFKQKTRLMGSTSAARQIMASNSSSLAFTPYPAPISYRNNLKETTDKSTTKMKTKITRSIRDDMTVDNDATDSPVHLPTAVLQIDHNNLPKFTLATSVSSSVSTPITLVETTTNSNESIAGTATTATTTTNTVPISATKFVKEDHVNDLAEITSKPQPIVIENSFKFSSPVMIPVKAVEKSSTFPNYTFVSPEEQTLKQSKDKECLLDAKKKIVARVQSETWICDDCWVSNKSDSDKCVCCGAKKCVTKTKHCSACKVVISQECFDKCFDCETKIDKVDSVSKIIETSKWKCLDCWVSNDKSADTCVCCGGKKPQELAPVAIAKSDNIASDWKCNDCWIKNKRSDDKCVACGGAKPTSAQNKTKDYLSQPSIKVQASNDSALNKIIKLQKNKWECIHCLVLNDKDKSKCLCCDTENPSNIKESEKNSFNFSTIQNTSFKFGIIPTLNTSGKKAESLPVLQFGIMAKESETNNNIVSKPSTFTFGTQKVCDNIMVEEQTIAEETPKQTFTFGVSKPIVSVAPATTKLSISPIETGLKFSQNRQPTNSIETDDKIQEVPNIHNIPASQNTQKQVGLFGIPMNSSPVTTTASALITFGQIGQSANTQAIPSLTTATVDDKGSQSTFSFSASGIKPGLPLFSTVTTASTLPTIQAPSTSSMSFFQKSEPVHTSSMNFFSKIDSVPSSLSVFNKTETTATTVVASSLCSAPVFSFGATTQNTPTAEKRKFNFTFGNNNSEPSLFSLPTSNTSNILSGNGLPSGTSGSIISGALATGNPLGGNSLPSNSLSAGLLVRPTKTANNIMWSSNNELDTIKMSSGNNFEQGINNNLSAIQSDNIFSAQANKDAWSLNQKTSNDTLRSLQLPTGSNVNPANSSVGAAPGGMFGTPEKKENMWSLSNSNPNMFAPNVEANILPKSAGFSFGSSMQFNSNNVTPAPSFGSPAQQTQNIFGMSGQVNNNQPDNMFSSNMQNQSPPNMFGAQAVNNNTPSVGMFGTLNPSAASSFGTPTAFETGPLNTVPAPTFNFGAQQTSGVFGFGQQQEQTQPGVYNFGAQAAASPQRQFNIGTAGGAPNAMGRRPMRRAVRRSNQR